MSDFAGDASSIASVEAKMFVLPLAEALSDAMHGDHTHFQLVTATVRLADGTEGTGYTYTGGRGGYAIKAMIDHDLTPFLIGRSATDIEALHETMRWHVHYVARGGIASFAISALDCAMWDIRGRQLGEPLWKMAGGASDRCRAYVGGIDLNFPLPKLLDSISGHLERGFNGVKIKIGQPTLEEDVERVRAVRSLIGPDRALMVDANYSMTVDQAIEAAEALQAVQPALVRGADDSGRLSGLRPDCRDDRPSSGHGRKPPHDPRI